MSWATLHKVSEIAAQDAACERDPAIRRRIYTRAARYELKAFQSLPRHKGRTRGITAVSAVSLFLKAGLDTEAYDLAARLLTDKDLPPYYKTAISNAVESFTEKSA